MNEKRRSMLRKLGLLTIATGAGTLSLAAPDDRPPSVDDRLSEIETKVGQTGPIQSQLDEILAALHTLQARLDADVAAAKESIDALTKTMGEVRRVSWGDPTGRKRLGGV